MNNLKFRRLISLIITFAMFVSMIPSAFAADKTAFVDFPDGWSKEAVSAAVDNGLLRGRTSTTIEPQGNLTRAEMATVINRAFGATVKADISAYSDVSRGDWFYEEIAKAVNMQTFEGDGNGLMRPNDFVTREEIFAVIARALVLESDEFEVLAKFNDADEISAWAKPYAAVLVKKSYVNGNDLGELSPKSNITREEFAQIMHNIVKTYFTSKGTYTSAGADSTLIRASGVTLRNVTIEGDLIIGDGVGKGKVNLENVIIKGRLLCRGGEDAIKLTKTTVGEMVVVKDVNGTVHFDNYRDEAPFKGIVEITKATFNKRVYTSSQSSSAPIKYEVIIDGAGYDNFEQAIIKNGILELPDVVDHEKYPYFAGWISEDGKFYKPGEKVVITGDMKFYAAYYYTVHHYYQKSDLSDNYVENAEKTEKLYAKENATVTGNAIDTTYYVYNKEKSEPTATVTISATLENVIKLYYDRQKAKVTFDLDGATATEFATVVYTAVGEKFKLPSADGLTKDGYYFAGWLGSDGEKYSEGEEIEITSDKDLTFKAIWSEDPIYRVKHMLLKLGGKSGEKADYECDSTETFVGKKGAEVTATPKTYKGFSFNEALFKEERKGVVSEAGDTILYVYYDRKDVIIRFDLNGGTATDDTTDEYSVKYGETITLPGEGSTTQKYKTLSGWIYEDENGNEKTFNTSAQFVVETEGPVKFVAKWVGKGSKTYNIEYYFEKLEGGYECLETDSSHSAEIDDEVTISVSDLKEYVGFIFDETNVNNVKKATVTSEGATLKVYFNRKDVKISFDLNDGTALDDTTKEYTVKYGQTITLPEADCAENGFYILKCWKIGDKEYPTGSEVDITGSDEPWKFVANWSEAELYQVIFYDSWGAPYEEYDVYENDKVEKEKFPDDKLESVRGYEKNEYISTKLYSGENKYVHQFKKGWYYNVPGTSIWLRFTPETSVTSGMVVDGKLHVRQRAPYLSLDLNLDEKLLSEQLIFSAFYEETEKDESGNVLAGTRFADTIKDILWESLNTQGDETVFQTEANKKLDLIISKLRDKGLISEDNSILPLEFFIKFAQIIGEDELEKYIVDNAKESLSDNDDLKKYIFDYFETVAKHGSDDDKKELEGLLEETVKGALNGDDKDEIMALIEELCKTMLDSPDVIEEAIKNVAGVEIDVTEDDLGANAKTTVLGWAELLISDSMLDEVLNAIPYNNGLYTSKNIEGVTTKDFIINIMKNADIDLDDLEKEGISHDKLFDAIKDALVKMILEKLEKDEDFFNKSVGHVFAGTPFATFTKDKVKPNTIDFFREVLKVYFDSLDIKELAVELGYADSVDDEDAINKFFNEHKKQVIDAIVYELDNDPAFFEHVISKTAFDGLVTYGEVMTKSVKELMMIVIEKKLNTMTGADLLEEAVVKSVIEDFDSIKKAIVDEIKINDEFFNEVMANAFNGTDLEGYDLSNIPEKTVDFVTEIIEANFNDMTDEELAKLAGYDSVEELLADAKSQIPGKIVENLTNNTDNAYDDIVKEFTGKDASEFNSLETQEAFKLIVLKYVADTELLEDNKEKAERIEKIIGSEYANDFEIDTWEDSDWEYFFETFEEDFLDEETLEICILNMSYGKYTFDETAVDKSEYPNATEVPEEPEDFIIGLIELQLKNELDATLEGFGYDDDKILAEAKEYAKETIINNIKSDETYLKDQIKEIAGVTLSEVKENSKDLIIDIIEAKLASITSIDDEFAKTLGFNSLAELIDNENIKTMLVEKAIDKAENYDDFLKNQIKEYTGIENQDLDEEAHVLFDKIVSKKVEEVDKIDDALAESLGYDSADALLKAAKPGVVDVIITDLGDDVENYRPYIVGYIGESFGEIPEKSMDFIAKYAKNVLESMTEAQIRKELELMGYSDDDIDTIIEEKIMELISNPDDELLLALVKMVSEKYAGITSLDELPTLAKDFVTEEATHRLNSDDAYLKKALESMFRYVPESFFKDATYTTKQFLVDIVIYMFENDVTKRDAIIDQAVKELVEKGDFSELEGYVDYAVDYLKSKTYPDGTTELDRVVDEIIELRYRDTLDKLVDQLINEDKFEIEASTSFILPAFEMQVKGYSFDKLIAGVPEALFKVYPKEKLEEIYNNAYNKLIAQIEAGKIANANGETAVIDTGLAFAIDLVDDIYAPLRNRLVEIVENSKAGENFYYAENPYLQELIGLTEVDELFDARSDGNGYKLKEYSDYYELVLKAAIIGDDALVWYADELTPEEIDVFVKNYEDLVLKYVNAAADILEGYAQDGSVPGQIEGNEIVNAVESALKDRFPSVIDKALDWYLTSPFNKDYTSEDYEKGREAIGKAARKAIEKIDITTDEAFDLAYKLVADVVDIAEGKITPENINKVVSKFGEIIKVNDNEYVATFAGKTVKITVNNGVYTAEIAGKVITINIIGDGVYTVNINGRTATLRMTEDEYTLTAGENVIVVNRSIQ